jgi:hypothetical protein
VEAEPVLEQPPEPQGEVQDDVLLHESGGPDGPGILAPMSGV